MKNSKRDILHVWISFLALPSESQPSAHTDPVSQNKEPSLGTVPLSYFLKPNSKKKKGVTCRKASPSPLPACWASRISFLLFSFLLWMLKRQEKRHTSSMKAMRPSMDRMATVRGGSLWAEREEGEVGGGNKSCRGG